MYIRQREPAKIVSKEWKLTIVFLRGLNVVSPDGNGRTGRLILNLELIRNGYPAINVKFTDRKRYYDAFDAFYRDGKADDMVLLVAEYVNERLDRYLEIVKE